MNFGGAVKINKCAVITFIAIVLFIIYVFSATSSTIQNLKLQTSSKEVNLRKLLIGIVLAAKNGAGQVVKIANEPDFGGVKTKGKTKEGKFTLLRRSSKS